MFRVFAFVSMLAISACAADGTMSPIMSDPSVARVAQCDLLVDAVARAQASRSLSPTNDVQDQQISAAVMEVQNCSSGLPPYNLTVHVQNMNNIARGDR